MKLNFETLKSIENEIIDNQKRLDEIEYELRENYSEPEVDCLGYEIIEIGKLNKLLELKRRHKLDRRNGWIAKIFWSILSPIIVSILISVLINFLN